MSGDTDAFEAAKAAFLEGLRCQQAGEHVAAERHYLASLAHLPGRVSTRVNLAATRLALGRPADALADADAALATQPDDVDALRHRADALAQLGRADEALMALDALLARVPTHPVAWSRRGSLLREAGRLDEAATAFRAAIDHGGDAELNAFYLAGVSGARTPDHAAPPRRYVETLFDAYAADFDRHLVAGLGYDAPQRLVDTVRHAMAPAALAVDGDVLDLGCGTGLCGARVRPHARGRLVGVDLAAAMLAKARELGVYDQLDHAALDAWLDTNPTARFGLVLAADVFIYVGDLDRVFDGVARVLAPNGLFAFTVESPSPADEASGWVLQPSLRYAHSRAYVERQAQRRGLRVKTIDAGPIRHDQAQPIDGLYVVLAHA